MNCDQVFDVLTRGPFPTGGAVDPEVEAHLLVCANCRQLAEALRPALELFEEAVTLEESRTLPGYWGNLHTGSESRVALAQPQPVREPGKLPRKLLSVAAERAVEVDWWRIAAAVLLGVLLGSWFRSAATSDGRFPVAADRSAKPDLQLLASMSLPRSCLNVAHGPVIKTADLSEPQQARSAVSASDFACCTTCHKVGSSQSSTRATSQAILSCRACHE